MINGDSQQEIKNIPSGSIDAVFTDPPYLYLKNQILDIPFDEDLVFSEFKRVLKSNGFIVLFGRGESFYRWNTMLAKLGFKFKEEIIWDKGHCSSPLMSLSRVHETVSIWTKGKGVLNKVKVPYLEMKKHDIASVIQDIKRLKGVLKNTKSLDAVLNFLENNNLGFEDKHSVNFGVQVEGHTKDRDRAINTVNAIQNGMNEKTIIRTDREQNDKFTKFSVNADERKSGDRCCNVIQSVEFGMNEKTIIRTDRIEQEKFTKFEITGDKRKKGDRAADVIQGIEFGMNEKSIIKQVRDHYTAIHPTQKPVALLERLLRLVCKKGDSVLDPFGGSFSTAEACFNLELDCTIFEINEIFFQDGRARIEKLKRDNPQLKLGL